MLVLEDPGGEPLDRLLGQPMELTRFLRFAVGLAAAVGKLHKRGLIHKDIKPALANSRPCRRFLLRKRKKNTVTVQRLVDP